MSDLTEKSLVPEDRDVLTGLADMYLFQREAESLQKDLRTRLNTVVFLNVEDFRRLNRTLGRDAGDSCLVFIAEQLKELFPEALISRLSDDHFVLLCKDEDLNDRLTKLHESVETWQANFVTAFEGRCLFPAGRGFGDGRRQLCGHGLCFHSGQ